MTLVTNVLKSFNVGMSSFVLVPLIFLKIIHLYSIAPKYVKDTDVPAPIIPYIGIRVAIDTIVMLSPTIVA